MTTHDHDLPTLLACAHCHHPATVTPDADGSVSARCWTPDCAGNEPRVYSAEAIAKRVADHAAVSVTP